MKLKKVTAIVRNEMLERVEQRLRDAGVEGISVTRVKGFGEYANFFSRDWLSEHARIEIYTEATEASRLVEIICRAGHTGTAGDGLVVVLPVDELHRIRDAAEQYQSRARDEG